MKYNAMLVAGGRYKGLKPQSSAEIQHFYECWEWVKSLEPLEMFKSLGCFTIELTEQQAQELLKDHRILTLEPIAIARLQKVQINAPWHLSSIANTLDNTYPYIRGGEGVLAYVVDTGIDVNIPDFEGRVKPFYSVHPNLAITDSHGTQVASVLGSKTYGTSKAVQLRDMRVFATGEPEGVNVPAFVEYLLANHPANTPAIVNLSFGWSVTPGSSPDLGEQAIMSLIQDGFIVIAAAGNWAESTESNAPARTLGVITVAATDVDLVPAVFTNYGPGIDLFAPGVNVSCWDREGNVSIASGTSFSSPIVAGVLANYIQTRRDAIAQEIDWIITSQSWDSAINHAFPDTTNLYCNSNLLCRKLNFDGETLLTIKNFFNGRAIVIKPFKIQSGTLNYYGEFELSIKNSSIIEKISQLKTVTDIATTTRP